MRHSPRFIALIVVLPALLLSGLHAGAAVQPLSDRIYLLASDSDYLYWGVDSTDPELGVSSISRICGTNYAIPQEAKPCLAGLDTGTQSRTYNLFFLPGSALDEKVTWAGAAPLRFHIEGSVQTAGVPYTLQLVLQKTGGLVVSENATQTSPGVWDGQLSGGGPLSATDINLIGVRVTTQAPVALVDLRLGGRTYLQLPRAFNVHGVPDMQREDTYSPQPSTYSAGTRSFAFNDNNWAVQTFTGDTTAPKTFDFSIPQKAEILLAWVDLYDSTTIQDVHHLRQPDQRKPAQGVGMLLSRGGTVVEHSGANGLGVLGHGTAALATADLAAGPASLVVDPAQDGADQALPYTVHVLEIRGERTLRSMHWLFFNDATLRTPAVATCPAATQPIPATDKVKNIDLDLDWDTEAPGLPAFTFRFTMPYGDYPCSEGGTGDELRLTMPQAERVWWMGAAPAYHATYASAYDTTFEMTARYTYAAPPAA
jgi:hypothetical protein